MIEQPPPPSASIKPARKANLRMVIRVFSYLLIIAVIFSFGYMSGTTSNDPGRNYPNVFNLNKELPEGKEDLDFNMFWRVWDNIHENYFDSSAIIESKLVYGAIKGMVAAVGDPYSVFLTPSENRVSTEDLSGNFEGVGIQIGFRGTQLAVIAPLPDSPAEKAGIQAGDFIVGITDEKKDIERGTVGISLPDAVQIIRGPAGSIVTLTLVREGEEAPIVADVTRESIDVPSVILTFEGEDESVARIHVLRFGEETLNEWDKSVIEVLKRTNIVGVVLDLRNNPGGFLMRSVDLAAEFLATDSLVVVEQWGDGRREEFRTQRLGRLKGVNLVVLINRGSASASEILAGALRDNLETPLVGQTSFGKGTIQEAQQLEAGTGLHLTIAKWLTPNDVWVNDGGLEPDIEVENDPETTEDEQLIRAIEIINSEK